MRKEAKNVEMCGELGHYPVTTILLERSRPHLRN